MVGRLLLNFSYFHILNPLSNLETLVKIPRLYLSWFYRRSENKHFLVKRLFLCKLLKFLDKRAFGVLTLINQIFGVISPYLRVSQNSFFKFLYILCSCIQKINLYFMQLRIQNIYFHVFRRKIPTHHAHFPRNTPPPLNLYETVFIYQKT